MIADLADLWRTSDRVSRFALVVAGVALLTHVASLGGIGWSQVSALGIVLHLSVMALLFGLFLGMARDRLGSGRRSFSPRQRIPLRRSLVILSVGLAVYALLLFAGVFAYYGTGETQVRDGLHVWVRQGEVIRTFTPAQAQWFDAHSLSVFSALWIAAALPLAIAHQRRRERRGHLNHVTGVAA